MTIFLFFLFFWDISETYTFQSKNDKQIATKAPEYYSSDSVLITQVRKHLIL